MKADEIFLAAVEKQTPGERAAYVDGACADNAELHAQVAALLRSHEAAGSFLERPLFDSSPTIAPPASAERPGTVIGPYKLLQQIGEGGMGTVFMAEQTEPIQRKVALKVIKPGMDSRQVVARFEAERQALAMMDHVNIARVFDGGATDAGRPYFVMELVHGVPITNYCDDNHLTPRERLELFVPVCQAIQHAHQKGIIHRDIKPSNVMVTLYDGKPVPKVIDFGVAKATEQKLTERTLFTQYGTMIGTLEYMSPEQAEMSALGVDTRSDIYSLGVLLYELLTGSTPLTHKRMKEAAYGEILRMIKEEEPPKPSTRLSDSGEALASISAQRHMEPAKLTKLMRGELDWIVMKTLEKDRTRRYETVNGFAMDVQRYLNDESVQACPASARYRLRKFVRRNNRILATAGVVVLALVLGTAVSTWQAILATQQATRATDAEGLAEVRLETANTNFAAAQEAKTDATRRLYRSLVEQARASRLSRRVGQRFTTLEVVAEAAKMAKDMNLPEKDWLELRNEAIACLALPDLRVAKEWKGFGTKDREVDFDGTLEHYACTNWRGDCSIRRSADGTEIVSLPGIPLLGTDGSAARPIFSRDGGYVAVWYYPLAALKMWKLDGAKSALLVDEPSGVSTFNFSPCSRLFGFGIVGGPIQLIELPSQRKLPRLDVGPQPQCLAFHPKERQFAVGTGGTKIQICDLDSGKVLEELPQPGGLEMHQMDWHPEGNILAVARTDRNIYLLDVAARKQIAQLEGHKNANVTFAFNHAGDLLASTCWDGILRLWDPGTGQQVFSTQAGVQSLRFSRDDRLLAAGIDDDKLRLWEVARACGYRTLVRDPVLGRGMYLGCDTSPRDHILAVGMLDGVGLWDRTGGKPLAFLLIGRHHEVLFEPSGALLSSGPNGLLRWPVQRTVPPQAALRIGPPQKIPLPPTSMEKFSTSLNGRVLATAQGWGGLVWNQDLPGPPIQLTPHLDTRDIGVSADGRWVATGSFSGAKVKIWDARTGKFAHELPVEGHCQVRFSPDGRWLATSSSSGGGGRLWAVDSWQAGPHIGGGLPAFFTSPDGKIKLLAVGTGQGIVRLVNPDTGREYARLEDPNQDRVHSGLTFSPDGSQLVTTTADSHSIHVWDLRAIRKELANMELDWDLPAYPPASPDHGKPLQIEVDLGDLAPKFTDKLWQDLLAGQESLHRFIETKLNGELTATNAKQMHDVEMKAGKIYVLDLESKAFDTYLTIEDRDGARMAVNDDISAKNLNSRIIFTAPTTETFRIIASAYVAGATGSYVVRIREVVEKK